PAARRMAVGLLVAVVCTGTFLLLTDSPTPSAEAGDAPGFSSMFYLETLFKLVGVLLLIVGSALVFRRWLQHRSFGPGKGRLAVMESVRLAPRQALHLVRVGEQYYLVGATDQSVALISAVPAPEASVDPAVEKAGEGAFRPLFASMVKADSLQTLFTPPNR
ncbi:MAG TPA: flagellar biosynthetic protein FliO, partial [Anaerolineaceae bacterium]|nr:flagellar biosynthetic protein FliO [Anaerolineaceae bacterium]